MKAEVLKIVNAASSEVSQSPLMLQLYRITQKLRQKWLVNFINLHVSSYWATDRSRSNRTSCNLPGVLDDGGLGHPGGAAGVDVHQLVTESNLLAYRKTENTGI